MKDALGRWLYTGDKCAHIMVSHGAITIREVIVESTSGKLARVRLVSPQPNDYRDYTFVHADKLLKID